MEEIKKKMNLPERERSSDMELHTEKPSEK
jgi:hypothetical protein